MVVLKHSLYSHNIAFLLGTRFGNLRKMKGDVENSAETVNLTMAKRLDDDHYADQKTCNNDLNSSPTRNHLVAHLRIPATLLNIFGLGHACRNRSPLFKAGYFLMSSFAFSLTAFAFCRSASFLYWDGALDMSLSANILLMGWSSQCAFSVLFCIYHARREHFRNFNQLWTDYNVDELINLTKFSLYRYFWFTPVAIFSIFYIINNISLAFLQHFGIVDLTWDRDFVFRQDFGLYFFMAFGLFASVAWILPQYAYYVVCVTFRYAWKGLCEKIKSRENGQEFSLDNEYVKFACMSRYVTVKHRQLSAIMVAMNKLYGSYILFQLATGIPVILLQLYLIALSKDTLGTALKLSMWLAGNIIQVLLISSACLITTSANEVPEIMYDRYAEHQKLCHEETGCETERDPTARMAHMLETSILLDKLYNTEITMSALGCFEVTRSFLMTLWSILVTYYMLLVQFAKPSGGDRWHGNCTELCVSECLKIG